MVSHPLTQKSDEVLIRDAAAARKVNVSQSVKSVWWAFEYQRSMRKSLKMIGPDIANVGVRGIYCRLALSLLKEIAIVWEINHLANSILIKNSTYPTFTLLKSLPLSSGQCNTSSCCRVSPCLATTTEKNGGKEICSLFLHTRVSMQCPSTVLSCDSSRSWHGSQINSWSGIDDWWHLAGDDTLSTIFWEFFMLFFTA